MPAPGVHLIFQRPPNTLLPVELIFGETFDDGNNGFALIELNSTGHGELGSGFINGNSSILVPIEIIGTGENYIKGSSDLLIDLTITGTGDLIELPIDGNSSIVVDIDSIGSAALEKYGNSDVIIEVLTSGYVVHDILGDSNITIPVLVDGLVVRNIEGGGDIVVPIDSVGTGVREKFGDSNVVIELNSEGLGAPEKFGDSDIIIDLDTIGEGQKSLVGRGTFRLELFSNGSGGWTGGYEMFGDSDRTLSIYADGIASWVLPISGISGLVELTIESEGEGTQEIIYADIFGEGSCDITLETKTEDPEEAVKKKLKIERMDWNWEPIYISINMVVDTDNDVYEIRNVTTNRDYLKRYRYEKWYSNLEIGSTIRDEFEYIDSYDGDTYHIERYITSRKYGCSEVVVNIKIDHDYPFIKNRNNIIESINRDVDRAILDTYSLYELEFE